MKRIVPFKNIEAIFQPINSSQLFRCHQKKLIGIMYEETYYDIVQINHSAPC